MKDNDNVIYIVQYWNNLDLDREPDMVIYDNEEASLQCKEYLKNQPNIGVSTTSILVSSNFSIEDDIDTMILHFGEKNNE